MFGFFQAVGEFFGIVSPSSCAYNTDLLCQLSEGSYKFIDYLPELLFDFTDAAYEHPYLSAFAAGSLLFLGKSLCSKNKKSAPIEKLYNLLSYKDNNDVAALLKIYETTYLTDYGPENLIGKFDKRPVLKTQFGAYFQAIPYIRVDTENAEEKQTISQTLQEWVIKMVAFSLITGKDLPHQLNGLLLINHGDNHWTELNAHFTVGDNALRDFRRLTRAYLPFRDFDFNETDIPYGMLNATMDFVRAEMGANVLPLAFDNIQLTHRDSVNHASCHDRVRLSSLDFRRKVKNSEIYYETTPNQKGNTCADHACFVGVGYGLFEKEMVEVNSKALREHTDSIYARVENQRLLETYGHMTEFEVSPEDISRVNKLLF